MLGEVTLNEILALLGRETKQDVEAVDIARIEPDGVTHLRAASCACVRDGGGSGGTNRGVWWW